MFRSAFTRARILFVLLVCGWTSGPWKQNATADSYKAPIEIEMVVVAGGSPSEPFRLSATVKSPVPDLPAVTGGVEFFSGDQSLGTATLGPDGSATGCHLFVAFEAGIHVLTAQYSGDANFETKASAPLVVPVGGGL